jgi:hypothetical protein
MALRIEYSPLGTVNLHLRKEMSLDTEGEVPICSIESERKTYLSENSSILAGISDKGGNPTIEVDFRLIKILENINRKKKKNTIPSEGRVITTIIDHYGKGYGVELYTRKEPHDKKEIWLAISQLSEQAPLKQVWSTSIQTDTFLSQAVGKLFIEELESKRMVNVQRGPKGGKFLFHYESGYGIAGTGRISLPHIITENKTRVIKRPRTPTYEGDLNTFWSGLYFDRDLLKLPDVREHERVLEQTSYNNDLQQIFFSVAEKKTGFMIQAKYLNGRNLEVIQVWDDSRRVWHSQICGSIGILDRLIKEYHVTFR